MSASNGGVSFGAKPERVGPVGGQFVGLAAGSLRAECATALRYLYGWLQVAIPQQPQLATVVPPLVQAVELYRGGQDDACAAHLQSVIMQLHRARALRPTLPPL